MKNTIANRIWQYFQGFLIYLVFTAGVPVLAFLFIREATNGFSRRGFEENFMLVLALGLLSAGLILGGSLYIFFRLRNSGRKLVSDGMLIGLLLTMGYSWFRNRQIEKAEEALIDLQEQEKGGWQPKPTENNYKNEVRDWEKNISRPDSVAAGE